MLIHRRRKMLKVGGAARTKIFRPRPLRVKPRPFCTIEVTVQCSYEFLDERTNSKSSRVDLAATYSHIYSQSDLVKLRKSVL